MGGGDWELRTISVETSQTRVILAHDPSFKSVLAKDWSSDKHHIALIAQRITGIFELLLLSLKEGALTSLGTLESQPPRVCFSPDAKFMAYQMRAKVLVLPTDGRGKPRPVLDGRLLSWTPAGIVFTNNRTTESKVSVVSFVDGELSGSPVVLGEGSVGNVLGFSERGECFHTVSSETTVVFVVDIDVESGRLHQPSSIASTQWESSACWSPDGASLVYLIGTGSYDYELELELRTLEGEENRVIADGLKRFGGHALQPQWSPDGAFLLAQGRDERNVQGIYRINSKTGEVSPIVQTQSSPVEWPVWCPDGRVIFTRWAPWTNVVVVRDPETDAEEELFRVDPPEGVAHLSVSPDGNDLVFVSWNSSTGLATLNDFSIASRERRELELLPELALSGYGQPQIQLAWTPDSRTIIYVTSSNDRVLEFFSFSIEGGVAKPLGLVMENVFPYGLSIHPQGGKLAFTAGLQRVVELRKVSGLLS